MSSVVMKDNYNRQTMRKVVAESETMRRQHQPSMDLDELSNGSSNQDEYGDIDDEIFDEELSEPEYDQPDSMDRMEDTLKTFAELTGIISDELQRVSMRELVTPHDSFDSEDLESDESQDESVGSSSEDNSDFEQMHSRSRSRSRNRSRSRGRQVKKDSQEKKNNVGAFKTKRLKKKDKKKSSTDIGDLKVKKVRSSKGPGTVQKLTKMLSRGIKSSMSIGSRTSKTKTDTEAGSDESPHLDRIHVVTVEQKDASSQAENSSPIKRTWSQKLLPDRIPKTIEADDGGSADTVSVLEEPPKSDRGFDDTIEDFFASSGLTEGIAELMRLLSPKEETKETSEIMETNDIPKIISETKGEETKEEASDNRGISNTNNSALCQDFGCYATSTMLAEINRGLERLGGYDESNVPFDEALDQKPAEDPYRNRTKELEAMLNLITDIDESSPELQEMNDESVVSDPKKQELLSLAKSFDDLLRTISNIEFPKAEDFKIVNSAPEETNSVVEDEDGIGVEKVCPEELSASVSKAGARSGLKKRPSMFTLVGLTSSRRKPMGGSVGDPDTGVAIEPNDGEESKPEPESLSRSETSKSNRSKDPYVVMSVADDDWFGRVTADDCGNSRTTSGDKEEEEKRRKKSVNRSKSIFTKKERRAWKLRLYALKRLLTSRNETTLRALSEKQTAHVTARAAMSKSTLAPQNGEMVVKPKERMVLDSAEIDEIDCNDAIEIELDASMSVLTSRVKGDIQDKKSHEDAFEEASQSESTTIEGSVEQNHSVEVEGDDVLFSNSVGIDGTPLEVSQTEIPTTGANIENSYEELKSNANEDEDENVQPIESFDGKDTAVEVERKKMDPIPGNTVESKGEDILEPPGLHVAALPKEPKKEETSVKTDQKPMHTGGDPFLSVLRRSLRKFRSSKKKRGNTSKRDPSPVRPKPEKPVRPDAPEVRTVVSVPERKPKQAYPIDPEPVSGIDPEPTIGLQVEARTARDPDTMHYDDNESANFCDTEISGDEEYKTSFKKDPETGSECGSVNGIRAGSEEVEIVELSQHLHTEDQENRDISVVVVVEPDSKPQPQVPIRLDPEGNEPVGWIARNYPRYGLDADASTAKENASEEESDENTAEDVDTEDMKEAELEAEVEDEVEVEEVEADTEAEAEAEAESEVEAEEETTEPVALKDVESLVQRSPSQREKPQSELLRTRQLYPKRSVQRSVQLRYPNVESSQDSDVFTRPRPRSAGSIYGGMPLDSQLETDPMEKKTPTTVLNRLSLLGATLVSTGGCSDNLFPKDSLTMMQEEIYMSP